MRKNLKNVSGRHPGAIALVLATAMACGASCASAVELPYRYKPAPLPGVPHGLVPEPRNTPPGTGWWVPPTVPAAPKGYRVLPMPLPPRQGNYRAVPMPAPVPHGRYRVVPLGAPSGG